MSRKALSSFLFLCLSWSAHMHAQTQTFYFGGEIGGTFDPYGLSVFSPGTSFAGSYTFDTTAPGNFGEVTAAHYTSAITAASVTVGGSTYTMAPGGWTDIYISKSLPPAQFVFDYYSVWVPDMVGPEIAQVPGGTNNSPHMNLYFTDPSASTFPDLGLPSSPPPAGGFGFDIRWFDSSGQWAYLASGTLSYISTTSPIAPIPEPETYGLLLAGLVLLGFEARRRKKHQAKPQGVSYREVRATSGLAM